MSLFVRKEDVIRKSKNILKKKEYSGLDVYLHGSIVKKGYSSHDVDIIKPTYGTIKQNKKLRKFANELSRNLKGFPVQAITFRSFNLKKGQLPYDFKAKRNFIKLKRIT